MAKKQFKTESKKLLDMMVNSIYTHKEIFLRELISNASDAIDKSYFASLSGGGTGKSRADYEIRLIPNKEKRTLTIVDNGCGMDEETLDSNLGVIAKSGSFDFKRDPALADKEEIDIIGQFGVGFYSAFMVADKITVKSRPAGKEAHEWVSSGADGYTVTPCDMEGDGTEITLSIKADTEDEKYGEYLDEHRLRALVKKYSDYIRYPIRMQVEKQKPKEGCEGEFETVLEDETLNSMIPLWKRPASEVTDEEYASFYRDSYFDFEPPAKIIRQKAEGGVVFDAMLFIPAKAPYDYYTRQYEKGLQLYSGGVMIMERCRELLPDHYSFVRGVVDSTGVSLNISRELLQEDRQLRAIAKSIEKKITSELKKMLENEREKYESFFSVFGAQLKYGVYSDYGMHKASLCDLLLFTSSKEGKYVTLREYKERMKEGQEKIYYASGESLDSVALLPQVESAVGAGYEVLYLTEEIDEFALTMLHSYEEKEFADAVKESPALVGDAEKEALEKENGEYGDMLDFMKESLGGACAVRFAVGLSSHPAALSSEGEISIAMEKTLNRMPGVEGDRPKAELCLSINRNHPVADKLKSLYKEDKEALASYTKILYANARLVSGLPLESPTELSRLVAELMLK